MLLRRAVVGSLYVRGGGISETVAQAIAQRLAVAFESAEAMEETARAKAARESEELRTLVLDTFAHDIKTPLTSIKASVTGLLSEGSAEPATTRDLLSVIDEEVDRLEHIVSEAVDMAQMDSGLLRLIRRPYDVRETVLAALEDLSISDAGHRVQVDVPESLPQVYVDFRMVKQAFKQLLDNALKYTPESTPITVTADVNCNHVVIRIADCGPGIQPQEQEKIFEKFYRGREGQRGVPGTGMGLAIAKRIVEQHGGTIRVASTPGSGSTFSAALPLYRKEG